MFTRTRVLASGVAIAAVALGITASAASANTAGSDIVTITAVVPDSPSPGAISVSVTSTTALTELDVTLTSTAHPNALSFTMGDFTLASGGTDTDGTYTLTTPVTDAQLPFDSYLIDVTAADSGGGSSTNDTTFLGWLIQSALTINASQTTFDYDNESITFSGTLSLVDPDGTADQADLAGQQLQLTNGVNADYSLTTGAGGGYSYTVGLGQAQNDSAYSVTLSPAPTIVGSTSPVIPVSAVSDPASVTAKVSATQVNRGKTVTVTGTAQYNPGTGFEPLRNSTVVAYGGPYDGSSPPIATAHTNLNGQYTMPVLMLSSTPLDVYAGGVPGDFFMDQVLATAVSVTPKVNVALPVKIASLSGSVNRSGTLTLKGCLTIVGGGIFPLPLQVQFSVSAGHWKLSRTVRGLDGIGCGVAPWYGERFSYKMPVAAASASYRLAYPGSKNYEPAVSNVVHETKPR